MTLSDLLPMVERLSHEDLAELRRWIDERSDYALDPEAEQELDNRISRFDPDSGDWKPMGEVARGIREYAARLVDDPTILDI
jgi:hypothetical protein